MSLSSIGPIEAAVHTTNAWLKELMGEFGWPDPERAYRALRVVLHALRDRLTVADAADLSAQLPLMIRGLFFEGWSPQGKPAKLRDREEFLTPIVAAFRDDPKVFPEGIAWAVFKVIESRVSQGEIGDVQSILPVSIRGLWPAMSGPLDA